MPEAPATLPMACPGVWKLLCEIQHQAPTAWAWAHTWRAAAGVGRWGTRGALCLGISRARRQAASPSSAEVLKG